MVNCTGVMDVLISCCCVNMCSFVVLIGFGCEDMKFEKLIAELLIDCEISVFIFVVLIG